ncbi:hypothetical protein MKI77_004479 [Escherichia coli]|nr:hypothetical protein [Escherichia coli]
MKDKIQNTSINPDVVEQLLALMNRHCKSSEEALGMLSALCYNQMIICGIHSIDSLMLNGHSISMQLQGIDVTEKPSQNVH